MKPKIAAYYFPNFHVDPLNEVRHGTGWTEWELVKAASPRFQGHCQPRIPRWGYEDESSPAVMERKIAAAKNAGLDAFIFDWYWYEEGEFLSGCLRKGFLHASNRNDLHFALMWANHDWYDIHPAKRYGRDLQYCGVLSEARFWQGIERVFAYMAEPNYWCVAGGKYFSFYDLANLIRTFGGKEQTRAALEKMRERAQKAGVGKLHINAIVYEAPILPGESKPTDLDVLTAELGLDSVGSYVWVHHHELPSPLTPYSILADAADKDYKAFCDKFRLPYIGNVTVGWDSSPRAVSTEKWDMTGYPFCPLTEGETPQRFEQSLRKLMRETDENPRSLGVVTINAWNEWTEGSYLEPDNRFGTGYLDVLTRITKMQ